MLCNNTVLSTENLQLAALTRVRLRVDGYQRVALKDQCWILCGDATDDVTAAARAAVVGGDQSGRDR